MYKIYGLYFICFVIYGFNCSAQEIKYIDSDALYDNFEPGFEKGKFYYPYYNSILVYSKPDFTSKTYTRLNSYTDSIKIIEYVENSRRVAFKGISNCWYKVNFPFNKGYYVGYIPANSLASITLFECNTAYLIKPVYFAKGKFMFGLKIIENKQLKSETLFEPVLQDAAFPNEKDTLNAIYTGSITAGITDNRGLMNIDRIIEVNTSYDACGYWNGTNYFLLRNNKIEFTLSDGGVADGGEYANFFELKFPTDNPVKPHFLRRTHNVFEMITDSTSANSTDSILLKWDGKTFTQKDSTHYYKVSNDISDDID